MPPEEQIDHNARFTSASRRPDPRVERDLYWRFHFADGEIKALQSQGIGGLYEPIINVEELRCGPIEVVAGRPGWHVTADIDWRSVEAAGRARKIDRALLACSAGAREALWRAYGARVDVPLAQLGVRSAEAAGVLVVQPLLCNLVDLAPEVAALHRRSNSPLTLRAWLERLSARAARQGDAEKVALVVEAARGVLDRAAREYGDARKRG